MLILEVIISITKLVVVDGLTMVLLFLQLLTYLILQPLNCPSIYMLMELLLELLTLVLEQVVLVLLQLYIQIQVHLEILGNKLLLI